MPGLRITGGTLRGQRVSIPPQDVRPTSERARQAYFNIVQDRVADAHFLDLFAGSGIFSMEALSRGAKISVAVDNTPAAVRALSVTAKNCPGSLRVVHADVFAALKQLAGERFQLVYADPPYDFSRYPQLVESIERSAVLAANSVLAIEHRTGRESVFGIPPGSLTHWKTVHYGEVSISLFQTQE